MIPLKHGVHPEPGQSHLGAVPQQTLVLLCPCEPSLVSHSWHPLSLVGSTVVSLSAKGTRAAPQKQLPLVFVPHGLPWPCAPRQYCNNLFFRASRGLLELFQGQTSSGHWCMAREPGDEPSRGKVGQCASAVINGIQESAGERLSRSFRLAGQGEDLLSDALDWLTININELFCAPGTCSPLYLCVL